MFYGINLIKIEERKETKGKRINYLKKCQIFIRHRHEIWDSGKISEKSL